MTLTELRYLVALDAERHFGRAAERSFVSQPTLSVALKKLEEQLGITLFERHRGEARPTPVGARIIEQAHRVLAEAEQIKRIAAEGKDELSSTLRVGAIYTVGPYLFPHLMPALRAQFPGMPLMIEENYTDALARRLKQNELDVIVLALPFAPPGTVTWPVYDEEFVVAMPLEHAWTERSAIKAAELGKENVLLLGPGNCFRDQVLAACPDCQEMEVEGQGSLAGSSLETIRHMVASGLGITVMPQSAAEEPAENSLLAIRPFAKPRPARRIALAWRRSFPRPKAVAALHSAIMSCRLAGVRLLPDALQQSQGDES
jgi:LysR family hydrogen peroxide-inducible transcriptional activator